MKLDHIGFLRRAVDTPYDASRPLRSFGQKVVRIFYLSVRAFFRDECFLTSSVLTFFALISIVPLLAIILSIATAFGLQGLFEAELLRVFKDQADVITATTQFAHAYVKEIKSKIIVAFGAIFLVFTIFGLFENLEKSINYIWKVKKQRALLRRSINYILILFVFPIVLIASTGATFFMRSIHHYLEHTEYFKHLSSYLLMTLHFIPYALIYLLFCYVYIFTPQAKVNLTARILAGILAGTIFQIWQIVFIELQLSIFGYSAIYGRLAVLPLFLIWMEVNFIILFFGAEIAAHIEEDKFFTKRADEEGFRLIPQKQLMLLVLVQITTQHLEKAGTLSIDQIAQPLGISLLDAREVLHRLEKAGVIAETASFASRENYQLIVDPDSITLQSLLDRIDTTSERQMMAKQTAPLTAVTRCYTSFGKAIQESGVNITLKALASPAVVS